MPEVRECWGVFILFVTDELQQYAPIVYTASTNNTGSCGHVFHRICLKLQLIG